ncbi:MAG: hypothetical protein ACK4NP_09285 [Parvularculaceae bacterium]
MALFETAESKARKRAAAEAEQRRLAEERRRLDARVRTLLRSRRPETPAPAQGCARRWPRVSGDAVGTAVFRSGSEASCLIRDRGFGGMRIEFSDDLDWSDEFALLIPAFKFAGVVRSVWKSGRARGVEVVRWSETA